MYFIVIIIGATPLTVILVIIFFIIGILAGIITGFLVLYGYSKWKLFQLRKLNADIQLNEDIVIANVEPAVEAEL